VELDPFSGFIATLSGSLMLHAYAIFGVPVSASQAIVGAVVGIGLVKGVQTVHTKSIVRIVVAWFVVPLLTMLLAMLAITLFPG
jgi:PiT family inorganic phosphate transporter